MPLDVPDDGFRHVGRCQHLEDLWCMYCRDTGDTATEHIAGLSKLKTYDAGATQITDVSLEILGCISALEWIEFHECSGITNAGVRLLAGLPQLREVASPSQDVIQPCTMGRVSAAGTHRSLLSRICLATIRRRRLSRSRSAGATY